MIKKYSPNTFKKYCLPLYEKYGILEEKDYEEKLNLQSKETPLRFLKILLKQIGSDDKEILLLMPTVEKKVKEFNELFGELPEELKDTVDAMEQRYKTLQEREVTNYLENSLRNL